MALQDYERSMNYCIRCSHCKWIPFNKIKTKRFSGNCPAISRYNFHSYSGGGRVATAFSLFLGRSEISEELLDIIYRCQLCGSCQVACHLIGEICEPLEIARELRIKCVEEGKLLPEHMLMIEGMRKEDNPFGETKASRGDWAKGLDLKNINNEKAEVVFHAGCRFSYDPDLRNVVRGCATLLMQAGWDVGIAGKEEACCGGRAFDIGYRGQIENYADDIIARLKAAGASKLVTPCADCYSAFRQFYPMIRKELDIEILHTTECLAQLLREGKIKPKDQGSLTVTYHDPCHLGRLGETYIPWDGEWKKVYGQVNIPDPPKQIRRGVNGVYEPPREILRSIPGIKLVEMERIREYSWCCGAGGGVREAYEDFSEWTALERIEEAKSVGAEALVTTCGWCERNFKDALKKTGDELKIFDITELLIGA
jgi:Fe-S oxidoreductase